MRTITLIVIHCSAVRPDQTSSAKDIDNWHKDRGFNGIGYHYVIRRDGTIELGRPEWQVGAHCIPHNAHSIGVCYEGGYDIHGESADTRTLWLPDIIDGEYGFEGNPRGLFFCQLAAPSYALADISTLAGVVIFHIAGCLYRLGTPLVPTFWANLTGQMAVHE